MKIGNGINQVLYNLIGNILFKGPTVGSSIMNYQANLSSTPATECYKYNGAYERRVGSFENEQSSSHGERRTHISTVLPEPSS